MRLDVVEASVVMCKCKKSHKSYGIRVERRTDNVWYETWAFPLSEKAGNNEGYGSTKISGRIELEDEYPGCPYCEEKYWVKCGRCGKLTCYDGTETEFKCEWCGATGKIQSAETFDLSGSGY